MNEHDATELAFKNGYKKCALDIFEEIEKSCRTFGVYGVHGYLTDDILKLKQKFTEEQS